MIYKIFLTRVYLNSKVNFKVSGSWWWLRVKIFWPGSSQFFVSQVSSGQPSLFLVWVWKISPKNSLQVKKNLFSSGQKVLGSKTGQPQHQISIPAAWVQLPPSGVTYLKWPLEKCVPYPNTICNSYNRNWKKALTEQIFLISLNNSLFSSFL